MVTPIGKHPPRPTPVMNRKMVKTAAEGDSALSAMPTEKQTTEAMRAFLDPIRALRLLLAIAPTAMPRRPIVAMTDADAGVRSHTLVLRSTGNTTASATTSKPSRTTADQASNGTLRPGSVDEDRMASPERAGLRRPGVAPR
ncbi:hypothetical protein Acsp07_02600 [Actinomycetospora sp. NBRC 106378]|nr:hypothetical protein Acsp07_02600 [Actinomycetospora sp. NBRC 106378]